MLRWAIIHLDENGVGLEFSEPFERVLKWVRRRKVPCVQPLTRGICRCGRLRDDVVDEAGTFESEMTDEAGHAFERTVEQTGIVKYACVPHEAVGTKGALVVVGAPTSDTGDSNLGDTLAVGSGLGLAGASFAMFAFGARSETRTRQSNS